MNRILIVTLITIATIVGCVTLALAEGTADERQDCTSDAFRLCGQYIPDAKAVTACMVKQKAKLSPACRKHFH
jgi:hypothetical protein